MLVSLACPRRLFLAVGGPINSKYARGLRYKSNVFGKRGYLCQYGQEGYQNENFRVLLQEKKEDLIDKCAQYKFRQCYPKEVKLTQKIKTF